MNIHTLINSNKDLHWATSDLNPAQLTRLLAHLGAKPEPRSATAVRFDGNYLVATPEGRAYLGLSRPDANELFASFNWRAIK